MTGFNQLTPRLRPSTISDTFGCIRLDAVADQVRLDIRGRHYSTDGRLYEDHGLANLSVAQARRLRDLLSEAIARATARAADADPRQMGLWSEATIAATGRRVGRSA